MTEGACYHDDPVWWEGTTGSHGRTLDADVSIRAQVSGAMVWRVLGALEAAMFEGAELPWADYEPLLAAVRAVDWDAILGDIFCAGQEYNVTDTDHETTAKHADWISAIQDALLLIDRSVVSSSEEDTDGA